MTKKEISSDTSFYIGFNNDLNKKDWLIKFVNSYTFYLGNKIIGEMSKSLVKDKEFISKLKQIKFDYYELIKPYFGRDKKHLNDGEYEAIGIAHYLYFKGTLHFLIIDEIKIRNFVSRHFPYLNQKLVGSIGFIRDCCLEDKIINVSFAIEILKLVKKEINKGKRVFGIDQKDYGKLVKPILNNLSLSCKNE